MKTPLKLHLSEYSTTHQSLSHPLVGKNIHYQVLPVPEYRNDPDRTKTSSNNE